MSMSENQFPPKPTTAVLNDQRAIEPLIVCLQDNDSDVRRNAAEALGKLADERAIAPLILCLKDADAEVRRQATKALGALGDMRAVEPMIACLKDQHRKSIR